MHAATPPTPTRTFPPQLTRIGAPVCPTCGSFDLVRQTYNTRVVYRCRRCGYVFN